MINCQLKSIIYTAQRVSVFGVILVRIQFKCGKIRARIAPNMDTFHVMLTYIGA